MMRVYFIAFLLFILSNTFLNAQLREFEISSLPKPEISLVQANSEFPDDALIIIYSSLMNLNFRSSMGMIDKQSYNQQSNRYELLVKPVKQIVLVFAEGYMELSIATINPQSKGVLYYRVEEKKSIISNTPTQLTLNSVPSGASISLNGIPVATKTPFSGILNPGQTRIQLIKAKHQLFDTTIVLQSDVNEVLNVNLTPSTVWLNVSSNPTNASVYLDGNSIGTTPLSLELDLSEKNKQGPRDLKLSLTQYAEQSQIIQVYPSKDPLRVNVELKKSEGKYLIESQPVGANVFIDNVYYGITPLQGTLSVGSYTVELKMDDYVSSSKKQIIINAQTTAMLKESLTLIKRTIEDLGNDIQEVGSVKDASGNSYKTVRIGNQVWMAENLITDRYSNGDLIPNVKGNSEWSNLNTGAWCNYDNLKQNEANYGKLYNWYAVSDSRKLCPANWHVPTDAEWEILIGYLGGYEVAGGKMKSTVTSLWKSPNENATNEYGFSGLPSGARYKNGMFDSIGSYGYWWSSSEYISFLAWYRIIYFYNSIAAREDFYFQNGLSVRCIKD